MWSPAEQGWIRYSFEKTDPGKKYLYGDLQLCVQGATTALVTGVKVVNPTGGLEVTDFATKLRPYQEGWIGVGNANGPLDEFGFADGDSPHVTGTCVDGQSPVGPTDMMVELTKTEDLNASGDALDVTYEVDGEQKQLTLHLALVLCSRTGPFTGSCKGLG